MSALVPPSRALLGAAAFRPEVTAALVAALREEWARVGYAALSLEAVARRAGVGKAALYRRWPSKLAMVSETFAAPALFAGSLPDRGSLEADLGVALRQLRRLLRHPAIRRILPDLHAEMPRSPELARLVRERVQAPCRAWLGELMRRAIIRRELRPGRDPDAAADLAADLMVAPLYWRLVVTRAPADDATLDALAATVMAGLEAGRG